MTKSQELVDYLVYIGNFKSLKNKNKKIIMSAQIISQIKCRALNSNEKKNE